MCIIIIVINYFLCYNILQIMKRKVLYFLVLIVILPVIFLQISCAKKRFPPPPSSELKAKGEPADETPAQSVAQKIFSFNLEGYRDNGKKKWELRGAYADILSNVIKLDHVTAKAYGDEGSLTLKAKTGIYDKVTKDIHLEKNVVGKSSDGARLLTDSLDWNQKAECVMTDALVRVEKDNLVSIGKGAVATPALKRVELKRDVIVEIKENPPTIITCDGPLVVDYKKNISILNNNVKISDQKGEIYSDLMKVLFDPKNRKITRVVAIGNVRIQREGNSTYSDRAIYTVRDGKVRLVGKPKIVVFPKGKSDASVRN